MTDNVYNLIILGGGLGGLTAAIWAGRASLTHLVFTAGKCEMSSMISTTSIVENFPGHKRIEGKDLIKKLKKQAVLYGSLIIEKCIVNVDFSSRPFKIYDEEGTIYLSASVIIATGSVPNRLGLENENKLWGKYISTCVTCDGNRFKNKKVVVLGGGDSALEEVLSLTRFTNKITLIHRRNTFRASAVLQKRVFSNTKIKVMSDYIITQINTDGNKLISIVCKHTKTNEDMEIKVDAMFYALGFKPNSKLFEGILELDSNGYIIRKDTEHFETSTSISGIFCAGDVSNQRYKQAIISSADGARASLDVGKYLHDMHIVEDEHF